MGSNVAPVQLGEAVMRHLGKRRIYLWGHTKHFSEKVRYQFLQIAAERKSKNIYSVLVVSKAAPLNAILSLLVGVW